MTTKGIIKSVKEAKSNVVLNILLSSIDTATRKENGFKSDLSRNLEMYPAYSFETLEDRKNYLLDILELF